MTDKDDEDLLTIAYLYGAEQAKSRWVGLTEEEILKGITKADPNRMDICPWSFRQGVQFAEQQLKERNT